MKQARLPLVSLLTIFLLAAGCGLGPHQCRCRMAAAEEPDGAALLEQLWDGLKHPESGEVEAMIADGFQVVRQNGAGDRQDELETVAGLNLGDYMLSDVQITRQGPVLVATYFVSVEETIEGRRLSREPAPRLSVFVRTPAGWKWVAHANLKPLTETE